MMPNREHDACRLAREEGFREGYAAYEGGAYKTGQRGVPGAGPAVGGEMPVVTAGPCGAQGPRG